MSDVEAELRAAHDEMWRLYRDAWESGREAPISPALFARLLADPDRAEAAIALIGNDDVARAQLEAAASELDDEALADAAPAVLTVVATLLPERVDAAAIAAQNTRLAVRGLDEARGRRIADGYRLMRHLFEELPWDAALHPALLARAAALGMVLDPAWPRAVVARAQQPEEAAVALTRVIWDGWGEATAREVLAGYLGPAAGTEVELSATAEAAPPVEPAPPSIPKAAPDRGAVLVAVAVGERLVLANQIRWKLEESLADVVRPKLWQHAVTVAHGGAPDDLPAVPDSFRPSYFRYEDLESIPSTTPLAALHPLFMLIATVPMEGRSATPEAARREFASRHESLIRQWRQVSQKTIRDC